MVHRPNFRILTELLLSTSPSTGMSTREENYATCRILLLVVSLRYDSCVNSGIRHHNTTHWWSLRYATLRVASLRYATCRYGYV